MQRSANVGKPMSTLVIGHWSLVIGHSPMRPKYSIILPTLNGKQTLSVTLPAMLRIDRDDVEWVISENHSDDGSYRTIREIVADDERVRLVRPPERLPLGKHLEFAYQQATGRWLSHIGDDDHLLPWRFELLDQVLDDVGDDCGLLRGEYLRYSWPGYPEAATANTLDAARFERSLEMLAGVDLAAELLNKAHIHGGGAWVVRSDLASAVRRRCGSFASPQHVEFFAMRAAAAMSRRVALLGLPLFILGRHTKSSGTQYFLPKGTSPDRTWNWSFEDPDRYQHSPFNWKSYNTLSLDAALAVQAEFAAELGDVAIDWRSWGKRIHSEMMRLVAYRQLPPQARREFLSSVATVPAGTALSWRWRTWRLTCNAWLKRSGSSGEPFADGLSVTRDVIELPSRIAGEADRFHSILEVPGWLEDATDGSICSLAAALIA
jgi:glycosyltransferase involved in cell wall biosynthesis